MTDPCKREACNIQNCLLTNSYDETRCQSLIDDLYRCCNKFYQSKDRMEKTPCCPQPELLQLKMKQRGLRDT